MTPTAGEAAEKSNRRPPAFLFALGHGNLPDRVTADGAAGSGGGVAEYRFVGLFKHDFFAATGLYEKEQKGGAAGAGRDLAVLKVQRLRHFWGIPMKWLGRRVAQREIGMYERLQGLAGIPTFLGRVGATGFLHAYIPGTDLHADAPLTPLFFDELRALFEGLHQRGVAYVDANKRENILFGDDGKPWLIDFQISYHLKRDVWWNVVGRWWFRRFVRADWYHFFKHKTRLLPEACVPEDFVRAKDRGMLHRMHRIFTRPITRMRRRYLARYRLEKVR